MNTEEIIEYISMVDNFNSIINDPVAKVYNFERLKYNLNEFYSFRLSKLYRLIVRPTDNGIEVEIVYISSNHYEDFDKDNLDTREKMTMKLIMLFDSIKGDNND